jgi:hypothetical protein
MKKTKLLWIFSGILIFINIILYLTKLGGDTTLLYVSDLLPAICSLVASISLYVAFKGFKEFDNTKVVWLLIFVGITLSFLAESIYGILEIVFKTDMDVVFPSVADYFWCIGYFPLIIGLIMMFFVYKRSGFPMGNLRVYILLISVYCLLFAAVSYFLLFDMITDKESNSLQKFFNLFYPIADAFLVIPSAILMYITSLFGKGTISKPWKYLALGFLCFTFADIIYAYLNWQGNYGSGNFIDVAWHSGYLLIGLAGLYQRELVDSIKGGE